MNVSVSGKILDVILNGQVDEDVSLDGGLPDIDTHLEGSLNDSTVAGTFDPGDVIVV